MSARHAPAAFCRERLDGIVLGKRGGRDHEVVERRGSPGPIDDTREDGLSGEVEQDLAGQPGAAGPGLDNRHGPGHADSSPGRRAMTTTNVARRSSTVTDG